MKKTLQCVSPIDGSVYAERPVASYEVALSAIAAAKQGQRSWAAVPLDTRVERVMRGIEILGSRNAEITNELAHMMGRPVRYGGEFRGVKERTEYMAQIARDALADMQISEDENFRRVIKRVPHGVIFVVAPWNFPYMTAINTVIPALIAGNAVIIKHAAQSLLVGERLVSALVEGGVPADVFQNLFLDHETTSQLIGERRFDFINFTGSVGGGAAMEKAAAGTFVGVGTELGGKDPAYVMEDADLDAAVETLVDGAMFNSGQSCCGVERIYVHHTLYDEFVEKAANIVRGYQLGNPLDPETTLGPMAHRRFADEVRGQIDEALKMGAHAQIDRFESDDGGAYLTPQILTNVDHNMRVMREESFGPVVGVMAVHDDEEAIKLMNDSDYGLTASLWTRDLERAEAIADQLQTGTVFMNRADYVDPSLVWTGVKNSGRGGGLSEIGYHNLTRPKSYHLKKETS